MFPVVTPRFEVVMDGNTFEFFGVAGARAFSRTWKAKRPVIYDQETRRRVPLTPRKRRRVKDALAYNGKAQDTPKRIAKACAEIRRRAIQLSGKKMSHPPEILAQAKREWLETTTIL